eukprot:6177405-Pleurochrysis_carterae.AAC.1
MITRLVMRLPVRVRLRAHRPGRVRVREAAHCETNAHECSSGSARAGALLRVRVDLLAARVGARAVEQEAAEADAGVGDEGDAEREVQSALERLTACGQTRPRASRRGRADACDQPADALASMTACTGAWRH